MAKVTLSGVLVAALLAVLLAGRDARADVAFNVNRTGDAADLTSTDGLCDASAAGGQQCTLRAAIQESNRTFEAGSNVIRFGIPGDDTVRTISPSSPLPTITEQVIIDGYTQPGASPNDRPVGTDASLKIRLDGSDAGLFAPGLKIDASGVVVRGLAIGRFSDSGIAVEGGSGTTIEGNFIGVDPNGTSDRGNGDDGVAISAGGPSNTTVGGTSPATRNLVSGNDRHGIAVRGGSSGNTILGNLVGTRRGGTGPLPNSETGVSVFGASSNFVGGGSAGAANTVAFNGGAGIAIGASSGSPNGADSNRVFRNSVFSNGGRGIDLAIGSPGDGPTANDAGDGDTGPNGLQNKPVLTSATTSSSGTIVKGKLASSPNTFFTVQFYSNPGGNEGKKFIGETPVSTDGSGSVPFTFNPDQKIAAGQTVTATATKNLTRDTSELSAPSKVVVP